MGDNTAGPVGSLSLVMGLRLLNCVASSMNRATALALELSLFNEDCKLFVRLASRVGGVERVGDTLIFRSTPRVIKLSKLINVFLGVRCCGKETVAVVVVVVVAGKDAARCATRELDGVGNRGLCLKK